MSQSFRFKVSGLEAATADVSRLDLSHAEMTSLMRAVGAQTELQTDKHFETGIGPNGKWAPLSPASKSINPKRKSGHPLSDTGTMRAAVTTLSANSRQVEIGVRGVHYAQYHQYGPRTLNMFGRGIRATLPERKFLGWSAQEITEIERIATAFIVGRRR